MFIRISLIVAIAAALFASGWNIVKVREKITTLISQRDDERGKKVEALSNLSKARTDLTKSQDALKQANQDTGGCEVRARKGGGHRRGTGQEGR